MFDFLQILTRSSKRGVTEIVPDFRLIRTSDLMIRGGDFYAVWLEDKGLWSTDEYDVIEYVDRALDEYANKIRNEVDGQIKVLYMRNSANRVIETWHRFCKKDMRDRFHPLDEKLIFSNSKTTKKDYASKKLDYPLEDGSIEAYDKLMSVLYSEEERAKIEWAIGSIVNGDSKKNQKFIVIYGAPKTGKSTILTIIQKLFDGYYTAFDAKSLGSSSNAFPLEAFASNPLVAIQQDGDLSRIEDNTILNSVVSHELMPVNTKYKSLYSSSFKAFLFMGTNKPVKITDAKSGLIRRLIDVSPTGKKIPLKEYLDLTAKVDFELGAIAYHCKKVYESDPHKYDNYVPISMLSASNDFYNFVQECYTELNNPEGVSLQQAWSLYKEYCENAKVAYPFNQRVFKEELKNYFKEYKERYLTTNGVRVRSYYMGFDLSKFENTIVLSEKNSQDEEKLISFSEIPSIFDKEFASCPAQYASDNETPIKKWENVTTTLSSIDTSKLHYVKLPENHIVIDFDIPDENGNKDFKKNLAAASKWPKTYAELSKSGSGIHLHYLYSGDPKKLSKVYDDHIEIKVFTGNSSLRRKLTKCNNAAIATISSGLPLKGEKVVPKDVIKNEKSIRTLIKRNLNREIHPNTKPSIDFIKKILDDAYESGMKYDVSDMKPAIISFASGSTNQASTCLKLVTEMKFKSEDPSNYVDAEDKRLIFYDIEVYPNLFLVNWKIEGEGKNIVRMYNPSPTDIENLLKFRLVGFNCRRYDNHILYARLLGYSIEQLFELSQKIIGGKSNCFFSEAYNLSYTDIYDFASAGNKMSLKKMEIEMGIHHQEMSIPWDKPVPPELWEKVAEYCDNDVIATEAAFNYLKADWTARQILADLAGMTVNDTTNSLTQRIIFGKEKRPQSEFLYRNLAEPVHDLPKDVLLFLKEACPEMMSAPHGEDNSLLPYFPGYTFDRGKSYYLDTEVGEGGYAEGVPGIYGNVALLDISSMHPHSAIAECLFGVRYTKAFRDIVEGRVSIKHKDWATVNSILNGKLVPYIKRVTNGELSASDLANALKTAINSVYGLTSASFDNPFRDKRNLDNIVAKRGALFMLNLKNEVLKRGYSVAHIKTDSIKIPNATNDIIKFVMDYGKRYGYTFEHEATYEKMCLVNDAVYVAKYKDPAECERVYGYIPGDNAAHKGEWTATGTQFQIPYVFKTLFSKKPITFSDKCETKSVSTALYLDLNESFSDVSEYEKLLAKAESDNKKGLISDKELEEISREYVPIIDKGHNYRFIGKVGLFCPVVSGASGGYLVREKDGKYYAATGTKGYRWLEAENVKFMNAENKIDISYYQKLVDDAVEAISKYGDVEWFISDDPYIGTPFN